LSTPAPHVPSEDARVNPKTRRFSTRHDLSAECRQQMTKLLNRSLATLSDLYSQIKQAHWNVKGQNFYGQHKLYDELAEKVVKPIDQVAERIGTLGGVAFGTVRMASVNSELPDFPAEFDQTDVTEVIADRVAASAKHCREAINQSDEAGDKVTADLYTQIGGHLDVALYLVEAHLHGRS